MNDTENKEGVGYDNTEEIDDFFEGNPDNFQEDVENSYTDEPDSEEAYDNPTAVVGENTPKRKGCGMLMMLVIIGIIGCMAIAI